MYRDCYMSESKSSVNYLNIINNTDHEKIYQKYLIFVPNDNNISDDLKVAETADYGGQK